MSSWAIQKIPNLVDTPLPGAGRIVAVSIQCRSPAFLLLLAACFRPPAPGAAVAAAGLGWAGLRCIRR